MRIHRLRATITAALAAVLAACSADPQALNPDAALDAPASDPGPGLEVTPGDGLLLDAPPAPDVGPDVTAPPDADASASETTLADVPPAELSTRACEHVVTYAPPPGEAVYTVHLAGSFNGWDPQALPLDKGPDDVFRVTLDLTALPPGSHGYKLVVVGPGGAPDWRLDPANKMQRFDDGVANSKLLVPDCRRPALALLERTLDPATGAARVEVAPQRGVDGDLDVGSLRATHNFDPLPAAWDPARGTFLVDLQGLPAGKHTFRFDADSVHGPAEPLLVSFWVEPQLAQPFSWRDAVLYFAFTDRFRDGGVPNEPAGASPCPAADPLGSWRGGDWKGVTAAIEEGYFTDLGVNALWLSAPNDNPEGCMAGIGGFTYTAYHGYFPVQLTATEERYGTLEDLRALVRAAHARGLRVLVDLAANHVHDTAPIWLDHQHDGWFNTPPYVCGWDQPETCWFQSYLPDLDYRNDAVVEHMTEVALWWAREADLDGFRVDAVKHVHPHFLYTLRAKLDAHLEAHADQPFWTVGETFTGMWGGGDGEAEQLIKQYIGDTQLYGQFDFPLYWAVLQAFGRHEIGLDTLGDVLTATTAYYDPGAIMASFLGNHDVARFVSHAAGQIGDVWGNGATEQGWNDPPAQPASDEAYERLRHAFTFLAATPWVPLVYYGDEVGLAGAGDPDNRRELPWAGLSAQQLEVRAHVAKVMKARLASPALRRGDLAMVASGPDHLVLTRSLAGEVAIGAFNRGAQPVTVDVPVPPGAGPWTDAVDGESLNATGATLKVTVPPKRSRLLVP